MVYGKMNIHTVDMNISFFMVFDFILCLGVMRYGHNNRRTNFSIGNTVIDLL